MSILIINQTTDKTFTFTINKKLFTLEPDSKNIIDTDFCPPELNNFRSTGDIFVTPVTTTTLDYYKSLSVNVSTTAVTSKQAKKTKPDETEPSE